MSSWLPCAGGGRGGVEIDLTCAALSMGEESPRATEGQPAYDAPGDPLREGSEYADADSPRVFKIVLTGGPCGGKTTALAMLSEFFRTNGTSGRGG